MTPFKTAAATVAALVHASGLIPRLGLRGARPPLPPTAPNPAGEGSAAAPQRPPLPGLTHGLVIHRAVPHQDEPLVLRGAVPFGTFRVGEEVVVGGLDEGCGPLYLRITDVQQRLTVDEDGMCHEVAVRTVPLGGM